MTTTFNATLEARAPDATKHVNYTLGMVLGVDDFNQDFAYVTGRTRWLARDAIGYGTLNGLKVTTDTPPKGPRITVTPGTALTPRGQLVCVSPAQCAYLNDWLAANKDKVTTLLGSPLAGSITLFLTLCYRDCPIDLVPIPGAPCRSEDELMAPSRLVDDFSLELRTTAPDQAEEDLLRELVAWWQQLATGGSSSVADFEAALKASVQNLSSPPSSPLSSPLAGHIVFGPEAAALSLDPNMTSAYLRAMFAIWIEEIRPKVHAICAGGSGCCAAHDDNAPKSDECLLLSQITVPVIQSSGNWVVDDLQPITLDESRRPLLIQLRLLQELIAPGSGGAVVAPQQPRVVAAGLVSVAAPAAPRFGNLALAFDSANTIRVNFDGYNQSRRYIVKAMSDATIERTTIHYVDAVASGIRLRVLRTTGNQNIADLTLQAAQFMIEVSEVE